MSVKVKHYPNGNIKEIVATNEEGEPHNTEGPAVQWWYENGQEGIREFWVNGELHNPDGPAVQWWFENGQEECREFLVNGKFHNPSGAAVLEWHENGKEILREFRVNGNEISEEEFNRLKNTVEITVEGKKKRISRQSAEELNLI